MHLDRCLCDLAQVLRIAVGFGMLRCAVICTHMQPASGLEIWAFHCTPARSAAKMRKGDHRARFWIFSLCNSARAGEESYTRTREMRENTRPGINGDANARYKPAANQTQALKRASAT